MLNPRRSNERGHADHGWLNTYHTFSFGSYRDSQHMGFRSLRVMNEDRVAPGQGFGTHAHDNMEIVSYVLEGALEHKDSMGNGEVLQPGEFQRITAGTGITHSEFNPSKTEPVHFYQIWLLPDRENLEPSYEQRHFDDGELANSLRVVASPDGRDGSLTIHQDASIFLSKLSEGQSVKHSFESGRFGWLQVLRGGVIADGVELATSDGAAISGMSEIEFQADSDSELLFFDLA